jgi:hypothetical protein
MPFCSITYIWKKEAIHDCIDRTPQKPYSRHLESCSPLEGYSQDFAERMLSERYEESLDGCDC